ncbi:MAG: hypothetical protein RBS43_03920 [Candidatus Cloacimonas sp.]|jgi:hypothetical protein|nr:hypothetical protein [Candidatus Cloacimonas sp.]
MKIGLILLTALLLVGLMSCSGDEPIDQDTTPPSAPQLIPHLGDTGDDPVNINGVTVYWNDDNNGIDTVPDGDCIKVPWKPFIDSDLSHVKIYRFSESELTPVLLNTVPAIEEYYLDQSSLIEREWYSYYTELYDASGNFSVSDTVSYALLAKSNLYLPQNGATVPTQNLSLFWNRGDSYASKFRVLVWNEANELIYSYNYNLATELDPLFVSFPVMSPPLTSGQVLRWRVDSFDFDNEHNAYLGSESEERTFTIQ